MLEKVQKLIDKYDYLNDVDQYKLILEAASIFIKTLPNGISNNSEFEIGIRLFKKLNEITMITSLHQYEYDYDLQNEILYKKLAVFRLCIPEEYKKLRGLTETLVGMKENKMDIILKKIL